MKDKKAFSKRIGDFLAGKGFYVVLFVCTAVIGVSAWILLFTGNKVDKTDTNSIASPQSSQQVIAPVTGDPGDSAIDTLEKKPEVSAKPSASPSAAPSASAKPSASAAPTTGKTDNNAGKSAAAMAKATSFVWPVVGDISVVFSQDELVYNQTMGDWRTHNGMDISAAIGAKVMAAADGTVTDVYADDLLGTTVVIDHGNGLKSIYANLAKTPVVSEGDKVEMGSVIGAVGDTALGETSQASHLHFAITKDDQPVDPASYLPKK
ncbi:Peptidase family M23 [Sporobacter termitidis DSM 10068]|uniref:Peptidase family M23 n=1 Tax=Sporobacter termitidis DSM 10068 TaxID=1123282 RepID=A0A1M5VKW5_9FIRM|nr:M23 family metallopeptidase [Sporobacter termitidis]SHH75684.1 Peptidase family M23 [Sporobacter termitidis DSM 10068]